MNLHEYQAKQLLQQAGLRIPTGHVCHSITDIQTWLAQLKKIGKKDRWVAKCQIHAGGRGLVGAVRIMESEQEIWQFASQWFGQRCVTNQTDSQGLPVNSILFEAEIKVKQDFYLSVVIDRSSQNLIILASNQVGIHIEDSLNCPGSRLVRMAVNLLQPVSCQFGYQLAQQLAIKDSHCQQQLAQLIIALIGAVRRHDLLLAEINPLIYTVDNQFVCVDAKVVVDDNALFRQPELLQWRDVRQEDMQEYKASQQGFSYIRLGGNIGCMVNGAGLAMATLDTISFYGGMPANFLDVGGAATKDRIIEAIHLILCEARLNGILVNIFGGILRCDLIADALITAVDRIGCNLPIVARLEGSGAAQAQQLLATSGLNIVVANTLEEAAQKIVFLVRQPSRLRGGSSLSWPS